MAEPKTEHLPDDIAALSFEDALAQLERIVQQLEAGDVPLEKSIEIYTRGTQLKQLCDSKLKTAQARIEKIQLNAEGEPETTPFDVD